MGVVSRKQLEQECGARKVCRKGSIDIVHQRLVQNYLETATGREMCGMVLDQNALQACMELFRVALSQSRRTIRTCLTGQIPEADRQEGLCEGPGGWFFLRAASAPRCELFGRGCCQTG